MSTPAAAAKLDRDAQHLVYEITTLVDESIALTQQRLFGPVTIALIEASLVHIRLLDEFFLTAKKPKQYPDQLIARDWLPNWTCVNVISPPERREIGAYLAHVSAVRGRGRGWPIAKMTTECCRIFKAFVDELDQQNPQRGSAFDTTAAIIVMPRSR